jgi:hypothetical protein
MYGRRHYEPESERGRDPSGHNRVAGMLPASGGGSRTSRSSSKNILEELQNIEQALSMVSSHSTLESHNYNSTKSPSARSAATAQQDWHVTSTPPRPSSSANTASRDPPLSNEQAAASDFYAKRFENNNSNNNSIANPRSPLVRFSEQLEVYSKHISQGCNAPTIPILRSKSSGSVSKRPVPSANNNKTTSNNHVMNPPSSTGSRDPTPRASIGGEEDNAISASRREPAGLTTSPSITSSYLAAPPTGKVMSDPPIDRSRRFLVSPAATMARPASTQKANRYQVRQGALSLHDSVNGSYNMTSILGSNSRGSSISRTNSDMELNPRRLSSQFLSPNHPGELSSTNPLLRQALAPTPTNREQAPTPNNKRSTNSQGAKSTPSPATWNMTSLFSNPCQSPFMASRPNDLPPLPSVNIQEQSSTSAIPAVLNIPRASSHGAAVAAAKVNLAQEDDTSDAPTTSSAESASALLMANYHPATMDQWEPGPELRQDEDDEDSIFSREGDEARSYCSEGTPPSTREILESAVPMSDSKIYYKNGRTISKPGKRSYLQMGDDGSLLQSSVGTEIMALPKSIEVRLGDSASNPEEGQDNKDCMGKVLHRFRPKSEHFQDGDGFSRDEGHVDESSQPSLIKKSTSETDESDSGIHFPRMTSGWDRFEKEPMGDYEDNEILIHSSARSRRRRKKKNKAWVIWLLLCTIVVCLSAGLPVYFSLTKDRDTEGATAENSNTPETAPPSRPASDFSGPMDFDTCVVLHGNQASDYSERYQTIRQYLRLMSVGPTSMLDQPNSPQRKALCWLAIDDAYQIDISDTNQVAIIQRYSLAVLYFSLVSTDFSSTESLTNTNFLSSEQECSWDAIMCSEPGLVSALLLSDKNLNGNLPAEVGNLENLCKSCRA